MYFLINQHDISVKFSVNEKAFDCTWICIVISHLNVFLEFIKFAELDILFRILVNKSPHLITFT